MGGLGEALAGGGGALGVAGSGGGLDQLGQSPAGEPLRRVVFAGVLGPFPRFGVVAKAVMERRGGPLDEAESYSLAALQYVVGASLDQLQGVGSTALERG